jgi:GT2 family glycosyltransferase
MPKVAVVILNWNGKKHLEQFLPSVIKHSFQNADVYVADNSSTDESIPYLKEHFPNVKIVLNEQNKGFAGGYNEALKHIKADYYILLNSDVEVTANWIKPIIKLMESDFSIAACQPKIKDFYNKNFFEYAGAAGGMMDKYGYSFCRGRLFNTIEEDKGQYDTISEIFWASGACLFIRSATFHQFNGFDEYFFAHFEEVDLCWRIKNAGLKIMYCPDSTVYHVGGGTLPKSNPYKTFLNFRNNLFMIYKNLPEKNLYRTILFRLFFDALASLNFLSSFELANTAAIIRAHYAFFKSIPLLNEKRKSLLAHTSNPNLKAMLNRAIIFDYFLKGRKKYLDLN